jgi:hypothetical protein
MERNDEQGPSSGPTTHLGIRNGRASEAIDFYIRALGASHHAMRKPS